MLIRTVCVCNYGYGQGMPMGRTRVSSLNVVGVDPMMKAPRQDVDESGGGPRTAVAEAVAGPLRIQPTINSAGVSSSMGQSLGMMQL
jgi:hypothetical protein